MIVMPPCFNAGDIVYFFFDTYDANGASVTITGLIVGDIEVYKNGSTTQRSSDNGYVLLDTDGIDFDGTTGLHGFSIDTSDNTDAGFWTDGAQYLINVNAITVDAQTVRFSYFLPLGYSLRAITAGRKVAVSAAGHVGPDFANIGSPTTTVNLSGTTIKTATDVATAVAAVQADLPQRVTKNVALNNFQFLMVDAADHVTGKTGLTITATRLIDNGTFAPCANAASEVASGFYRINLAASDLNGDVITFLFTAAGADARSITFITQPT